MTDLARKRQRRLTALAYAPQDEDRFVFGRRQLEPDEIVARLSDFLTEERRLRIEEVLEQRTNRVATVVEGIVDMGNVSAVMRSAEALGFQPFHVVTGGERFKNSQRSSQGAEKWLDVYRWDTPSECVSYLKDNGFRVVVTHLDERSIPIDEIDFTKKTAFVFGNELDGVSAKMIELSDDQCVIPMSGFVQSFNISVAAAVALYHARQDRLTRNAMHGDLTEGEKKTLRAVYYLRSVKHADRILKREASS